MTPSLTNNVENLSDEDLDKLVESGDIISYSYKDVCGFSENVLLEFPSGVKLRVSVWSTESSGLSFETI